MTIIFSKRDDTLFLQGMWKGIVMTMINQGSHTSIIVDL